ncbi:MAG TPA: hypothetical protein PLT70_04330, partial [bacterium]|nr:hypothetical protein [bacterium]
YIYSAQGTPVIEFENRCCMLDDGTKGEGAAMTLLKIYEISANLKMNDSIDSFSLAEHTFKTVKNIMNIHPEIFVLGFRFSGWLNEWIKDKDGAMVQRETEYLNFLREMI